MKKNRIYKVKFETNEGPDDTWVNDHIHVLASDAEKAIAKAKRVVKEKRKAKFRLDEVGCIARADYKG